MAKLNNTPSVKVIVDLQYGSTGKGVVAGMVGMDWRPTAVATGWGSNAGHTMITEEHGEWVSTQIASCAVMEHVQNLFIGGGSMIDPFKFCEELDAVQRFRWEKGYSRLEVIMCNTAMVITQEHQAKEAGSLLGIGSTMKGNSAAIAQKLGRSPIGSNIVSMSNTLINHRQDVQITSMDVYIEELQRHDRVLVEGAQGFSLGVNQRFYPYCTSRECTPQSVCTESGIPYTWVDSVIGVMRTYPIRVSNRFDKDGKQVGWSGPIYEDQKEVHYASIHGHPAPELTTVTRLQRRIFTFSQHQLRAALRQVAPDELFLSFCDYLAPNMLDELLEDIKTSTDAVGYDYDPMTYLSGSPSSDAVNKVRP